MAKISLIEDDSLEQVENTVADPLDQYVYMDSTKEVLRIALETDTNVILYGKGGHGKSELSLDFLRSRGIEPFVLTMGSGMNTDRLFGGLNLLEFNKTGKLEYLVENSFMNQEYVIFEELFDAPDFILEQLKDILSSKIFRNGSQMFEIKTRMIICNTNKTRGEFSKNNSLAALMERFPIENEVKWEDYNRITYENLLNKTLGFADPLLCYTLEKFAFENYVISPRIAIKAATLIGQFGPDCLLFIADFAANTKLLGQCIKEFKDLDKINTLVSELSVLDNELIKLSESDLDSDIAAVKNFSVKNKLFQSKIDQLTAVKVGDSNADNVAAKVKYFKDAVAKNQKLISLIMA